MNHCLDSTRHSNALWEPRQETTSHLANKMICGINVSYLGNAYAFWRPAER